jgi:hypothetical protein
MAQACKEEEPPSRPARDHFIGEMVVQTSPVCPEARGDMRQGNVRRGLRVGWAVEDGQKISQPVDQVQAVIELAPRALAFWELRLRRGALD